ncbi:MAG: 3-dehydroquinate synthase [Verrucomicrobiota bacterium]
MTDQLTVDLGHRSYPICFADSLGFYTKLITAHFYDSRDNIAIIYDNRVGETPKHFADGERMVKLGLDAGEAAKSFQQLELITETLAEKKIDRGGAIIAEGGGVIGDLAGFAAATYLRGIDFYQVPTTLLAMVDSSVGGKTGINIKAGKNLVGAFWQPKAVFICTDFLRTLPLGEFLAGMAEVIKYGMLYDRALFDQLVGLEKKLTWDHAELPGIIRRCCEIKAAVVKADETETAASGGRALLNLGHTFAHAIENVAGYGTYLHGEAVGIGLVMAAELSLMLTKDGREGYGFSAADVTAVRELVAGYGLMTKLYKPLDIDALMDAMRRDKKVRAGQLRFIAMEKIGRAVTVEDVSEAWIRELWQAYGA